jgi:hypothetical protein
VRVQLLLDVLVLYYSLGPDGIGTGTAVVLPPFALLHKVCAANELHTQCVAVRLGVTDRREEMLRLAGEVRLVRPAVQVRVSARSDHVRVPRPVMEDVIPTYKMRGPFHSELTPPRDFRGGLLNSCERRRVYASRAGWYQVCSASIMSLTLVGSALHRGGSTASV